MTLRLAHLNLPARDPEENLFEIYWEFLD